MCRDRRRHYDDGFMRVVADLIRGGAGRRSLARRLGAVSTAGKWVLSYRFGGEAALMGEREGNRRYDYETKLAAVRDHVEHGLTKAEVMEEVQDRGSRPVGALVPRVPVRRPDALRPKPKGRPGARNQAEAGSTREQLLEEENAYLKARVAYRKKSTPCWRGDRQPGQNGDRLHAGGAGDIGSGTCSGRPDWRKARITIFCRIRPP